MHIYIYCMMCIYIYVLIDLCFVACLCIYIYMYTCIYVCMYKHYIKPGRRRAPRRGSGRGWASRLGQLHVRNSLGWLETRLAQNTLNYL